ncbi:HlyD family type I secretion periplasmic adaptor subunit [Methylomonas sp. SURF-2]|uniref:Membrane fusion protein (MFP) family protein n=1 Tax=Methylomonas subterranea TaxID=2952225 RepID=A0ABT1TC09_9GAMM|nr:HlyD family type I secretion periplasmic adaptor subunit [Methylomonas sp. SURF-2]MCQ8102834.1 HlyD family type I secretion periplasmic adaptor subunit [Methylomonas sp. SURF-2]
MTQITGQLPASDQILLVTDDKPIRNIGMWVLIFTFGILGGWGYFAPLDSSALAPGFVSVKSYRKTVQHFDGGIVRELLIKEGDLVEEGQVLIRLDTTEINAQLEIIRAQYIALLAQVARLTAEREQKSAISYPESLNDNLDARIVEVKQVEEQIFHARKISHEGEISVLNQRISQLKSRISGLQGQRSGKKQLVASYEEEIHDMKELLAEGFAGKQRVRDLERNLTLINSEIASLAAEISGDEIQIGETRLQILQLQKQFQEEVAAKLGEAQALLYDVTQRMVATRDRVIRTEIRSPSSGRVLGLTVHTLGSVISPGRPILEIVPQQEELVVTAQVSPIDIDRVRQGLLAEVRFSAFKQALAPKLEGKVTNISADRLTDDRTGASYYQAEIELTRESIEKLVDMELLPGMPAEVLINTGERTAIEYLLQPITNAFSRAFIED